MIHSSRVGGGLHIGFCILGMAILCEATLKVDAGSPTSQRQRARQILASTGVKGGLVVHLGCGDGKLTAALHLSDSYLVQGLDTDPDRVASARENIHSAGLYGPVSVVRWTDPSRLPYADNLVNLLVVEEPGKLANEEMLRVLAPGGTACVKEQGGRWGRIEKPRPKGMDDWSHWDHGPDGNPVSQDVFVGPPRRMQWTDGPAWSKKHWGPRISAMVTAGGRLFLVQDETPTSLFNISSRWALIARDAMNGVVLWRRELPHWTTGGWGQVVRRGGNPPAPPGLILGVWGELAGGSGVRDAMEVMVAAGERLYVPLAVDAPLSALDAASGKILRTYQGIAPVEQVEFAEGVLLVGGKGQVRAVEPETGSTLWEAPGGNARAKDGLVFVTSPGGRSVVCLDLKTGRKVWEVDFAQALRETGGKPSSGKAGFNGPLQAGAGIVLAMVREGKRSGQTIAISAAQGKPLWRGGPGDFPFARGGGPFFIDGLLWTLDSQKGLLAALDPHTGQAKQAVPAPAIRYVGHHARCYLAKATCRYIIAKERGADFVDLVSGDVAWNNWLRGPCHRGVVPANGLLYAGQHSCRCYTEAALHGFFALAPEDKGQTGGRKAEAETVKRREGASPYDARLERGPAYRTAASPPSSSSLSPSQDWPTYRHDAARSGSSPADLAQSLAPRWATAPGGRLSAPVVAAGRVFVAAVDRHAVYALDADSGEIVWQYTAGARVDSPPTIYESLALFGCRDGWVYCLRADDGVLAWRFRAAPEERMVGAGGQLESAWPVPGSILIKDGAAYCVAGRSSFLDGGLYMHALEPSTGRLLYTKHLDGPWPDPEVGASPEEPNRGYTSQGALPDVLVADAENIYLRHLRFDRTLEEVKDMQPNFYKSPSLEGENSGGDHKFWDNLIEAPRHANFTEPAWFHRSFFQNFPGMRLYATTGLLDDDSWHRRMYWSYGQVVGQYIVFRGQMGYAVQVFATSPREGGSNAGDGYVVYAGRTAQREEGEKLFALRPDQSNWRVRVPLRPVAMALAGQKLILAGPPDFQDPGDALAAVEGRKGALLWILNADDGRRLAEMRLESPPAYDAMAVAGGRIYMATTDGRLACFAEASSR